MENKFEFIDDDDLFEIVSIDLDNPDSSSVFSESDHSEASDECPLKYQDFEAADELSVMSERESAVGEDDLSFEEISYESKSPENVAEPSEELTEDDFENTTDDTLEDASEDSVSDRKQRKRERESRKKEERKKSQSLGIRIVKEFLSYAFIIAAAFVLAYIADTKLILNANIPSGSMYPTIVQNERIIGYRLAYNNENLPQRGDVAIFLYPDDTSQKYVKRIIGLPGDIIQIVDGLVYVNGEALDESDYLIDKNTGLYLNGTPYGNYGPYIVPSGCYFMMGDNRNSSWDSRFWVNTYVPLENILAKAVFCYYPDIHKIK